MSRLPVAATLLFAALCAAHAFAADAALARLHDALVSMRRAPSTSVGDARGPWNHETSGQDYRFATPALSGAKHLLRGWIDMRLATAPHRVREQALAAELNTALRGADLFCQRTEGDAAADRCAFPHADWNAIGFVHPDIRINRPAHGVLAVRAGLGIECGSDASAYIYEWRDGRWQRFWQYEQPIADDLPYEPQWIDSVEVSPPDTHGARLVLMLGNMDWCVSTYYPVYARLWRTAPGAEPKLLLSRKEPAWLNDDPPVTGTLSLTHAQFEFRRPGIDAGAPHTAVMHYRVQGERVTRAAPFARDARAFFEEWLYAPWTEGRGWLTPEAAVRLEPWHRKLAAEDVSSGGMTAARCRDDAALRQITVPLFEEEKSLGTVFVLVAVRPDDRFELRAIAPAPRADCDQRTDE